MPVIASRPFGAMFQVTGSAATQTSRVSADATGAAANAAAPVHIAATSVARRVT